jgi:hypothetical protein
VTRYKVEFITASDEELSFDKGNIDIAAMLKKYGVAMGSLKVEEVDERPWTHRKSKWAGDRRWAAILAKVDEISLTKPMAMRGSAMESERSGAAASRVYCKAVFYTDRTVTEKEMYLIEAYYDWNDEVVVKLDGPYDDSSDDYWLNMAERDKREGNGLITEDYYHYTVHPNSAKPGQGDGHGGAEFKFRILDNGLAARLMANKKLNVDYHMAVGDRTFENSYWYVTTRNLWAQSCIPRKHRHLFKPNVRPIALVKPINPLDVSDVEGK